MKKTKLLLLAILLNFSFAYTQEEIQINSGELKLSGTLLTPKTKSKKVVLLISGSGNTDRDGNSLGFNIKYTNNSLKMLAEALAQQGIASLRYDKRGVGKSTNIATPEETLRFDHFVQDAIRCIEYLEKDYDQIVIAGHSQGALVGMLAAQQTKVYKFISLAGLSSSGYSTLKRQLGNQPKFVTEAAFPILDSLQNQKKVDSVPAFLQTIFRPQIQGYLISFLKYDPQKEIKKLDIPILVIQGTNDLQITVEEAKTMVSANKNAILLTIEEMNHVLKKSEADLNKNLATYSDPNLPLHKELVNTILKFTNQ